MIRWKDALLGAGMVLAILLAFAAGRATSRGEDEGEPVATKVDTLLVHDTVRVTEARYITRRVVDSVAVPVPVTDTLRLRDTLYVYLEREQVAWEDSLARVYASGIRPQVDSVIHFRRDMVVTKEVPVVRKTRWGVGVQAGVGAGKAGLTPYVGVGVSYNVLSW